MPLSVVDWIAMLSLSALFIVRPNMDLVTILITTIIGAAGTALDLLSKFSSGFDREMGRVLAFYPCMAILCYFVSTFLFQKAVFLIAAIMH